MPKLIVFSVDHDETHNLGAVQAIQFLGKGDRKKSGNLTGATP